MRSQKKLNCVGRRWFHTFSDTFNPGGHYQINFTRVCACTTQYNNCLSTYRSQLNRIALAGAEARNWSCRRDKATGRRTEERRPGTAEDSSWERFFGGLSLRSWISFSSQDLCGLKIHLQAGMFIKPATRLDVTSWFESCRVRRRHSAPAPSRFCSVDKLRTVSK